MKKTLIAAALSLLASLAAQATTTVAYSSVFGSAGVNNAELAGDGFAPADGTFWQTQTAWWFGDSQSLTFVFDQAYQITGMQLTVDNNDFYRVSLSTDGTTWQDYYTVLAFEGSVGGGVETFTPSLPATAAYYRYARVVGFYGDGANSVGELKFSGVAAPVPETSSAALLLAGLGAMGLLARRRRA